VRVPRVCSQAQQVLWNNLLVHFKDRGCLVEGPLNNLKPCLLQFNKPRTLTSKAPLRCLFSAQCL
jgi:hypothetical protein